MSNETAALIVAKPTRFRDGLRALLRAMPQIEVVVQADNFSAALRIVAERAPAFILLDSSLLSDQVEIIRQTKIHSPRTYCIVLADNVKQQQLAWANGADEVLLAGFSAPKLFASIEKLLSSQPI